MGKKGTPLVCACGSLSFHFVDTKGGTIRLGCDECDRISLIRGCGVSHVDIPENEADSVFGSATWPGEGRDKPPKKEDGRVSLLIRLDPDVKLYWKWVAEWYRRETGMARVWHSDFLSSMLALMSGELDDGLIPVAAANEFADLLDQVQRGVKPPNVPASLYKQIKLGAKAKRTLKT